LKVQLSPDAVQFVEGLVAAGQIVASARLDLSDLFDYTARDKPIATANWIDKIESQRRRILESDALNTVARFVAALWDAT